MRYLVTGGAGFIGGHLCARLLRDGHQVRVLDNLSTGRYENVADLEKDPHFSLVIGSVVEEPLLEELVRDCDAIFHLASAVGVRLIMERPVEVIETIFHGTDAVLRKARRYRKRVLLTSSSEVYGKSENVPFEEDGDRLEGPTTKHRWAYACAKAMDEFLALAHWKETRLPVICVRLFNTVGPRQSGQYGMVIPRFVSWALQHQPIEVHGDGAQSRCFCHVHDVVEALFGLMECPQAVGQVINIGSDEEVTIRQLADRVVEQLSSRSEIRLVPYQTAFGADFEDMRRRIPSLKKIHSLIGWRPRHTLSDIITDVARQQQTG